MHIRIMTAAAAALAAISAPAAASTLVLYDFDAQTGQRLARTAYLDLELQRMERLGLTRGVKVAVDDRGAMVEQAMEVIPHQYVPPMGGTRILTASVTWTVRTQITEGRLRYSNVIYSEQGYSNGQGPLTDYRNSEVTVAGEAAVVNQGPGPTFVEPYTSTRGNRVMIGILRP